MTRPARRDLRDVEVIAPNLSLRYSGVTSTLIALLPFMQRRLGIAALSAHVPADIPRIGWEDLLRQGWARPARRPFRIWHARGNHDMMVGMLLAHGLRQPLRLVFTSAGQRRHKALTRFLLGRMDGLIATSPQSAAYLDRTSTVIMHGVDTERFRPAPDRAAAWAATGLPGRYGIGIFGRIRPQKGTDLFVDAMIALLPEQPDWTAVIIGPLLEDFKQFRAELEGRIAAAGLQKRVLFLGGQEVRAVPGWYRALSIVVAPPRWEGFGLVPLEAMASGTPVVATRAGAHESLVEDFRTGRLVPRDEHRPLIEAISDLMAFSEAERDGMGRAGRARVEALFPIEREAAAITAVYEALWRAG